MQDKELTYWTTAANQFLVAIDTQTGQIMGCISYKKIAEDIVQMHRLLVDPKCRGHGIGRKLVQELMNTAKQNGFTTMYLETSDGRKTARKLYEDMGFQFLRQKSTGSFLVDHFTSFATVTYIKQI